MCLFDCAAGILSSQFSVFSYRRGVAGGLIGVWCPRLGGGISDFGFRIFGVGGLFGLI
jgi:hypothetical protein